MAKRMHCFIFPYCIFVLQNLNTPTFHSKFTEVVWSHQDYPCFSKIKMSFPLALPFCWDEVDKGNLHVLLCGKDLDRLPGTGSLEPGQLCCQMPGGLGNLGFSQRTSSSGVLSYEKRPDELWWCWEAWKHLILNHPHPELPENPPSTQGAQVHCYL